MNRLPIALLLSLGTLFAAAPAAADAPKTRATAGGTLQLDTRLSHGWLPVGKPATIHATVTIKAREAVVSADRAPLNIALVFDRSTSMSGEKFTHAIKASHLLVDTLGTQDRLAIVSYGSDVTTHAESMLATPANKELLHNAVDSIQLAGSTNLSGGYERGRDLVLAQARDETVNRVILLSDGHANVGVTTPHQLGALARAGLERGISLSTFGVGLDYNEDIMTTMAVQGAGNYHFVENENAIASLLQKESMGLAATVARNTTLELEMAPGVELLDLDGYAFTTKGNKAHVRLAEFISNQQKDMLLQLAVSAQASGTLPVVTARLRFDDVTQGDKRVSSSATVTAVATSEQAKLAEVDREVMHRAQQVETARAFDEAMKSYESGDADKAAQIAARQRVANEAFMQKYDFEDDQAFGRVDGELQSLEQEVKQAAPSSTRGKRLRKSQKERSYKIKAEAAAF